MEIINEIWKIALTSLPLVTTATATAAVRNNLFEIIILCSIKMIFCARYKNLENNFSQKNLKSTSFSIRIFSLSSGNLNHWHLSIPWYIQFHRIFIFFRLLAPKMNISESIKQRESKREWAKKEDQATDCVNDIQCSNNFLFFFFALVIANSYTFLSAIVTV